MNLTEDSLTYELLHGGIFIILYAILLPIAKRIKDILTPHNLDTELTHNDNPAVAWSLGGYFIGVTAIIIGALLGSSEGIVQDLMTVSIYSAMGIALLQGARVINDKLIFHHFSFQTEIVNNRNIGAGVVEASSYCASGLIIAGSIHGEGGDILTALAFFCIGQLSLLVFARLYELITPYTLSDEIQKNNTAAGVGFSGSLIAIGIIIMKGISGDFTSWQENLIQLGWDILLIIILLLVVRFFFDKVIIPKSDLHHEIAHDGNVGAGVLESVMAISFATLLFFLM
jgi:uncharacterized membrane protein YjfL (UPF0719 family)